MANGQPQSPRYEYEHSASMATNSQLLAPITGVGGRVLDVFGFTDGTADVYIQIFDASALPPNTTVPKVSFQCKTTDSNFNLDISHIEGLWFKNGAWIATSSTPGVLTLSAVTLWWNLFFYSGR